MDQSQTKAALIMIQSIQAQLVGLMNVLGLSQMPTSASAPHPFPSAPQQTEFLSDEEEDRVEQKMEAVRQEAEKESATIQDRWAKQRAALGDIESFA